MSHYVGCDQSHKIPGISTVSRNPVDNPLALRASCRYAASVRSLQT